MPPKVNLCQPSFQPDWTSRVIGLFNTFCLASYGAGTFMAVMWIPGRGNDAVTVAFSVMFGYLLVRTFVSCQHSWQEFPP